PSPGIRHIAPSVSSAAAVVAANISSTDGLWDGDTRHTPAISADATRMRRRILVIPFAGSVARVLCAVKSGPVLHTREPHAGADVPRQTHTHRRARYRTGSSSNTAASRSAASAPRG